MQRFKYLLIIASVVFVVGSTFSVLYFLGPNNNSKPQIEISSPFVDSSLQPTPKPTAIPTATPTIKAEENSQDSKDVASQLLEIPDPTTSAGGQVHGDSEEITNLTKAEIKEIRSEINNLESRVSALEESITGINTTTSSVDPNQPKEYYVYLGSGTTRKHKWVEITQAVSAIDTNNYGQIKSASFESALSITSGIVYARLKNKTTDTVLYETEISHNSSSSVWKQSQAFNLTSGYNEYVVELRSSSDEEARLDGARIKIIVE